MTLYVMGGHCLLVHICLKLAEVALRFVNSYHSQCDSFCNTCFIKYVNTNFSLFSLCLYLGDCQKGHETMGYWVKMQKTALFFGAFFFYFCIPSLGIFRAGGSSLMWSVVVWAMVPLPVRPTSVTVLLWQRAGHSYRDRLQLPKAWIVVPEAGEASCSLCFRRVRMPWERMGTLTPLGQAMACCRLSGGSRARPLPTSTCHVCQFGTELVREVLVCLCSVGLVVRGLASVEPGWDPTWIWQKTLGKKCISPMETSHSEMLKCWKWKHVEMFSYDNSELKQRASWPTGTEVEELLLSENVSSLAFQNLVFCCFFFPNFKSRRKGNRLSCCLSPSVSLDQVWGTWICSEFSLALNHAMSVRCEGYKENNFAYLLGCQLALCTTRVSS